MVNLMVREGLVVIETKGTAGTLTNARKITAAVPRIASTRKDPFTALVRMISIWIVTVGRVI